MARKAIICEYHTWDSIFRIGNHHYARELIAGGWDVLWISHPVSPIHGVKKENADRMAIARSVPVRHTNGPLEYIPLTNLPFLNKPFLNSIWVLDNTLNMTSPSVKNVLEKTGFAAPDLLWITDTSMHSITGMVNPGKLAVRIADDNTRFREMPGSLRYAEKKLCEKADTIFVTSSPLYESHHETYGGKVHLLRNGVQYEHFQGEYERPEEFRGIENPIAIYVGAIEEWFNVRWIEKLASERKNISIILIGLVDRDLHNLKKFDNVHILGPRPYRSIPAYLNHADCGIIPFHRTELVESVSPIKLFEFFASGLPVVTTSWNELESLGSPATLCNSIDEFVANVSKAIDDKMKKSNGEKYREYAKGNSWHARFSEAMNVLGF
ncbi:MAG TPA: glycosyltransferase [bacterium]|jgi:glycosyltransferase involved in cell wall biosynthesis